MISISVVDRVGKLKVHGKVGLEPGGAFGTPAGGKSVFFVFAAGGE
jgi:hypothetical protein